MSDFAISNPPQLQTVSSSSTVQEQNIFGYAEAEVKVDLKEALNVVIGEDTDLADLSQDEIVAVEQRRVDLMMWLLNLELRLSPYTADFA